MSYLTEAFKQMELLESEQFTFDKEGAAKLANFLNDDMLMDFEAIIDPEAETKEELKDSYMGNVICRCPICKSLVYRDPEEIKVDEEEQLANIEEPCPYCFEAGGFEIVGQVAPYEEVTVETTGNDKDVKVEVDGEKVEVEESDEDDSDEVLEESLTESNIYDKLVKAFPELADENSSDIRARRHTRDNEDLEDSQRFPVEGTNQRNLVERRCAKRRHVRDNEDLEDSQRYPIESPAPAQTGLRENANNLTKLYKAFPELEGDDDKSSTRLTNKVKPVKAKKGNNLAKLYKTFPELKDDSKDIKSRHSKDNEDLEDSQRYPIESPQPAQTGLREGMEDISITTDDQVIKVKATPRTDKETIQPVEEETKDVIETPVEEEVPVEDMPVEDQDIEIEEFDEKSFDNLGESYLKQVYENVNGFRVSDVQATKSSIIVEGIISFNSGKKAKTKFMFEAKDATKNGKLRFTGLNENLSNNKKAFTLTGTLKGNKLISESLNYNYTAKSTDGKSKRLYGTVKA